MKIEAKTKEEILEELVKSNAQNRENIGELTGVLEKFNLMILEMKKDFASVEESMNRKILERDNIIKSQTESLKFLAESIKRNLEESGGATPKSDDLHYLAKILRDGGYLETKRGKKA